VKKPAQEAMRTIDPPPLFAICKRATLVPLMTAVVLVSMIFSSSSSVKQNQVIFFSLFHYHPLICKKLPSIGLNMESPLVPIPALSNAI
jgi:hypothetical protein